MYLLKYLWLDIVIITWNSFTKSEVSRLNFFHFRWNRITILNTSFTHEIQRKKVGNWIQISQVSKLFHNKSFFINYYSLFILY